jgi:enoyl-CoA hydratase
MEEEILLERNGGVAEIVLNRPQKLNAVTPAMAERLDAIARQVQRDGEVRVILLRGNGERAFCSGSDLRALETYPSAWRFRNRFEYAAAIRNIRKPVVAALHGWVLGGGAEMALSADVRFMARNSKFGFPEVTRGWVGGGGATQILPRIIGYGQAMRLLLPAIRSTPTKRCVSGSWNGWWTTTRSSPRHEAFAQSSPNSVRWLSSR